MSVSRKPCCCHVQDLQVSTSSRTSSSAPHITGMALRVCALLAVLIATTHHTEARASQRGGPLMYPMEPELADSVYEPDQRGSREMANLMLQVLQRTAQQQQLQQQQQQLEQQQQQQLEHQDEGELDSNPLTADDFPIVSETLSPTDKRGSYMSLCHFKICNMGRKRNLRKSQWGKF